MLYQNGKLRLHTNVFYGILVKWQLNSPRNIFLGSLKIYLKIFELKKK